MKMRALMAVGLAPWPIGCASIPHSIEPQNAIVIDGAHLRAVGPDWQSELVDCSDTQFRCFEAPGRFLMAFPRNCPRDDWRWVVAGHPFRLTAPMPHRGLPSGGYFSAKYPHAYLLYDADEGFTSLWVRANPVMSENWGGRSVAEYKFRYVGKPPQFRCQ
jgi:hypothetical protein